MFFPSVFLSFFLAPASLTCCCCFCCRSWSRKRLLFSYSSSLLLSRRRDRLTLTDSHSQAILAASESSSLFRSLTRLPRNYYDRERAMCIHVPNSSRFTRFCSPFLHRSSFLPLSLPMSPLLCAASLSLLPFSSSLLVSSFLSVPCVSGDEGTRGLVTS